MRGLSIPNPRDPFCERPGKLRRRSERLLGGRFTFESTSGALLDLVGDAYDGLGKSRLGKDLPDFLLRLQLTEGGRIVGREPPPLQMQGGAGSVFAGFDAANFAVAHPQTRRGLVAISREMLRFPYHARYELLEFAVFTLASRAQELAPLHGACVGRRGAGLLLIGDSGAGKSTVAFQCISNGMDFLAEDAVFVAPELTAVGVANFMHLREDSLRFIAGRKLLQEVRRSPVIRRRSGVEKFEIDVRRVAASSIVDALKIVAVVFVTNTAIRNSMLLAPLPKQEFVRRFSASQPYAAGQSSWPRFSKRLFGLRAFELRRGGHPADAVRALQKLLG